MANYGPADLSVDYDNSGGTPVGITAHVLSVNDVDVENILEEVRPFGDAWDKSLPIGVGRMPVVELGGVYDDVGATGRDAPKGDPGPGEYSCGFTRMPTHRVGA